MRYFQDTIKAFLDAVSNSQNTDDSISLEEIMNYTDIENYSACREEGTSFIKLEDAEFDREIEFCLSEDKNNIIKIGFFEKKPVEIFIKLEIKKYLPLHINFSGDNFISCYAKEEDDREEENIMTPGELNDFLLSLK